MSMRHYRVTFTTDLHIDESVFIYDGQLRGSEEGIVGDLAERLQHRNLSQTDGYADLADDLAKVDPLNLDGIEEVTDQGTFLRWVP